jgi:two-component system response regulator AtoC
VKPVIVVDDDERTRRILQMLLERLELSCEAFECAPDALELLRQESAALVLTDLRMPGMNGVEFLRELRELDAEVPVIVLTAYGTVESAVEAMKLGAIDFISKPFDMDALEVLIGRSLDYARHRTQNEYLKEQASRGPRFEEMIGESNAMRDVFALIEKVAPTKSSVLITGETGTGKELVASAIHNLSPRADHLFVALNCSAIPSELLESELFGHVKGAFSGAHTDRIGKFQAADGGTLFLDEVGDMDVRLQAKLLRVVQEGVVEPVGSNRRISVDVRIVSSTNRNLESAMSEGDFREDLFYRLNVFAIELPALRDRRADVPALARFFLSEFGRELGRGELALTHEAAAILEARTWRGNVRELRNLMERAAVLCDGAQVDDALIRNLVPGEGPCNDPVELAAVVGQAEKRAIERALEQTGDNKAEAASVLGIGERTLWTKLKKYGV